MRLMYYQLLLIPVSELIIGTKNYGVTNQISFRTKSRT